MSRRAELSALAGPAPSPSPLRDAGPGPQVWHRCRCGRPIPLAAKRCSARTCVEFGPVWARATRRRLLENLRLVAADRLQGQARYPRLWEKQQRGLAHVHGVISVSSPAELAWARDYVEALRELAPSKGFGFVDGWHKIGRRFWPGDQAGAYLSSYFVRGRGRKAPITENVLAGDLPRLVVFVGPHLTAKTCCTMRNLRNARRVWAWQQGLIDKRARGAGAGRSRLLAPSAPIATRAP